MLINTQFINLQSLRESSLTEGDIVRVIALSQSNAYNYLVGYATAGWLLPGSRNVLLFMR
jgi:hypothetical protein